MVSTKKDEEKKKLKKLNVSTLFLLFVTLISFRASDGTSKLQKKQLRIVEFDHGINF